MNSLPDWNDLPQTLRTKMVEEAETLDPHCGGDCVVEIYRMLREGLQSGEAPQDMTEQQEHQSPEKWPTRDAWIKHDAAIAQAGEPVAWGRVIDGKAVTISLTKTPANDEPLFAAPPAPVGVDAVNVAEAIARSSLLVSHSYTSEDGRYHGEVTVQFMDILNIVRAALSAAGITDTSARKEAAQDSAPMRLRPISELTLADFGGNVEAFVCELRSRAAEAGVILSDGAATEAQQKEKQP